MSDDNATSLDFEDAVFLRRSEPNTIPSIPKYCEETYWWAYLHPRSAWFFERPWVVNLILWGHMGRLTDAVLETFDGPLTGPTLQVACVYGQFSSRLARQARSRGSRLHLLDVAPIQLDNARGKLADAGVRFHHQDSTHMNFADDTFERTVVFFLLHEQPEAARRRTIAEAIRVTRPGGKVVFVDYHRPRRLNPLRYLMQPVLRTLEPFALDLWQQELSDLLGEFVPRRQLSSTLYGGDLYQRVILRKDE